MKSMRFALIPALLLAGTAPILAQSGTRTKAGHAATAHAAAQPARPSAASRYRPFGIDLSARDPARKRPLNPGLTKLLAPLFR